MSQATSAIPAEYATEEHSFIVDFEHARLVRLHLNSLGIPFKDRFHWFLWREFVVKGSPAVLLQIKRDVSDLQHAEW